MKSRISYFNGSGAMFKKNVSRFAPLWAVYTGFWFVVMTISVLNTDRLNTSTWEITRIMLRYGASLAPFVTFAYAAAVAMAVFGYIFNTRSANMIHALPMRREGLFVTNFLSGIAFAIVPHIFILAVTALAEAAIGLPEITGLMQWFLMINLEYLFFFGFAVFIVGFTGNIIAMPAMYAVLNFTAIALESAMREVLSSFVYGMSSYSVAIKTAFLSPLYNMIGGANINAEQIYADAEKSVVSNVIYSYSDWHYLIAVAAVGLLFAAVSFMMYRRRRIELAGDVISVNPLRPVFKYCFTVGCSLILGILIASMVFSASLRSPGALGMTASMLCGGFIGYFAAEMMLKKTVRVFRREWIGFGIYAVCLICVMAAVKFDLFGYEKNIPAADEIASVTLRNGAESGNASDAISDPDYIARVMQLHSRIIAEKAEQQALNDSFYYSDDNIGMCTTIIKYELTNGKKLEREYTVCNYMSDRDDSTSLTNAVNEVYNDPKAVVGRYTPSFDVSERNINYVSVDCWYYDEGGHYIEDSLDLTQNQAWDLYQCVLADAADGAIKADLVYDDTNSTYACRVEIDFSKDGREYNQVYVSFAPTVDSKRVNAYLESAGASLRLISEIGNGLDDAEVTEASASDITPYVG